MKINEIYRRCSSRLKEYDYSAPGAYFITICTYSRECILGTIDNRMMVLNDTGEIVKEEWFKTKKIRPYVRLNESEFVIMPNHIHGIIWIVGATGRSPLRENKICGPAPKSIGAIIGGFKCAVTKRVNELRKTPGFPFWQRNYYEHVIRNEQELTQLCDYILNNPLRWEEDENYQKNTQMEVKNG